MRRIVIVVVLGLLGWQGYQKYQARTVGLDTQPRSATVAFSCDGRIYCSQMTSCEEASYFLRNCPGVRMDGDHDGIACEQQWCRR